MILKRILLLLILISTCSGFAEPTLDEARMHYENGLVNFDQRHASAKRITLRKYVAELKKTRGMLKSRGPEADYEAVGDEITRVGVLGSVDDFESNSQYVQAAKSGYKESIRQLDEKKRISCVALGKKWIEFLEKEKDKLEKAGKDDEAAIIVYELDAVVQEVAALDANLPIGTKMVMGTCTKCNGAGRGGRPCFTCKGSSKCTGCRGSGKKAVGSQFIKCSGCRGEGKCMSCKGKGETMGICSMCKGKKRCYIADPNVDPVFGVAGLKMAEFQYGDRASRRIRKQPGGMKEYIENMTSMTKDFKAGKAEKMRLSQVMTDPDEHLGKLYSGKALVISAFPRGVILAVKVNDEATGIELTPHTMAVGMAATKLFESAGKGAKVSIVYGFANREKPVLFEIKSL